jgi:hypothetical protein
MTQFNKNTGDFDSSEQWKDLFFGNSQFLGASNVHWIPNGPLGSSRRASSRDLTSLRNASKANRQNFVQLLHAYAIAHNPIPEPVDMGHLPLPLGVESPNLLVFGRAGSGKTQSVMLPAARHALESGWSMAYVNVKGIKQTRFLRRMVNRYGRSAQTIAPTKLNRTVACTLIEGCSSLAASKEVAEAMVANSARRSRYGEGAWAYNQAEEFLQHAIAAICTNLPKSRRNLTEIRKVVQSSLYQEFADQHTNFPMLKRFARYVAEGNKNAETITSTIAECTAFVDEIEEFLSRSEFSFESFAQQGGVLIIEIDQADVRRLRPFVTLFLTRLKSSLQRKANSCATGCLPNKTVFIIDELVASGPIPGLAEDLHTCRELNFSFVAGAQSISQLATIYGDDAQVVLDGFQTQIAIAGGLDWVTAEHLSRRSGISTIALPGVHEPGESDGDIAVSRHWQLSSRPVYLPSEIASPIEHPHLGMPATIVVGDGKTPAFQAYLTPCHQDGALAKMMDDVVTLTVDDDLRKAPLKKSRKSVSTFRKSACPESILSPGISNTKGWTEAQLKSTLEQVRTTLDWDNTTRSARKWWITFEEENKSRLVLVLRLAEELAVRKVTITEFFLAYVDSNTDNIQANLYYLDYTRLKKEEEVKKRKAAEESLEKAKEESPKDESDFDIFEDNAPAKSSESKSDPDELTFVRCNSCRSLVTSNSNRCRVCGLSITVPALDIDATTGYEVILASWGSSKLEIVKVVKNATGKSLLDSKKLVESAPTTLGRARSCEDAAKVVQEIQGAGGEARIA